MQSFIGSLLDIHFCLLIISLTLEDESAVAYFRTYWSYRISVAVASGTAAIVHHVPRGESVY